ncbi:MAG: PAS domain-containing protein [Gallionella sp.]|nr:PAS domain-containing protein [Gallionella sp.]
MQLFENLPIKRKLMHIGFITNGVAVVLLSVLFGAGEWTSYRDRAVTTLSVHAGITADNAASALIFADEKAAQEVLARLSAETNIVYAALQGQNGGIVAKFEIPERKKIPVTILASDKHLFFSDQLVYAKNVVHSGETVGVLYLQSDLRGVYWELFKKLLLIAVTMMFSLAFAVYLFARFQKSISDPILNMAEAMRGVITEQNFVVRVVPHGQDELGMLAGTFNIMLEYIQLRDTELAQYREHLEEEVAQRAANLIEAQRIARLGNWEWDIEDKTLVWSDEVYRIFDIAPQQFGFSYEAFLQAVHPEDRQLVDTCAREALEQGLTYSIDHRIVRPDGTVRYVHEQAEVLCNEEGQPVRMHGTVQDITERKQAEEELRRSNTDLEQFAYAASHDMRQPLRMISSYLQLLEYDLAPVLTDETRQNLQFATEGAKRMDQMLMALLDYSRIGRKADTMTVIDSREVMYEALHYLEPAIEEARADVRINGVWPHLFASRDEILRLFQNLIDNALKYRLAAQKPVIAVSAQTAGGEWRLEVRDNGIGLLPGHEARLFKVFERLQSRSRYPGTGIGLALCRKIVEHHKGRIWVESPGPNQGCTFIVTLPVSLPSSPGGALANTIEESA